MFYVQQYQHHRQMFLRKYQSLNLLAHRNFSICSNEYNEKFPEIYRPKTSNVAYSSDQTLLFLSGISSNEMKSTTDNQQKTSLRRDNRDPMRTSYKFSIPDNDKKLFNDNADKLSIVSRQQTPNSMIRSTKTKSVTCIRNRMLNVVLLRSSMLPELERPTTAPLVSEKNVRRSASEMTKAPMPSPSPTPYRLAASTDTLDNQDDSTEIPDYQYKSTIKQNDNHSLYGLSMKRNSRTIETINTNNRSSFYYSSFDPNSPGKTINDNEDEPKTLYRSSQCRTDGFQHIVNLGSWQRNSKTKQREPLEQPKEKQRDEETSDDSYQSQSSSSKLKYEYKSPFSEEYNQAILLHIQCQTHININEWNLKDFYRDVKTSFEPDTNSKPVFEKCLKLARLQAHTIKWEQRRRQNLILYNRLLKNGTLDNTTAITNNLLNTPSILSPKTNSEKDVRDLSELKRELRCNECKRLACLGNCAPGNEYRQYKRYTPISTLATTREQMRNKLNLRTQRLTTDFRPCSMQPSIRETKFKFEPTNINPVVVLPLYENESQSKRPPKKLTHRYLPAKTLRQQRRETLAIISTSKV